MRTISSKDNSIIKEAASLQEKKYRDSLGLYLVEGPNLVKEAMSFGGRPRFIFLRAGADEEARLIAESATEPTAVYELSDEAFCKISDTKTPQGIIAVLEKKEFSIEDFFVQTANKNILVLDRLQDPGNVGTLIRLSEAMDFGGVIFIKGSADPYQNKVVRAASGAIQRIPMLFLDSANDCITCLNKNGKKIFAACMNAKTSIYEADLKQNVAIVIGNEGNGVSSEFQNNCESLYIPMSGYTESLNAAIAGTIIMYESKRQKQ